MEKSSNKVFLYLLIFFVGCLAMYSVVYFFPVTLTENVTKYEKDVTVNENGIADAVEKIYDSVVVVSTYKNETAVGTGTGFIYKKDGNTYYILTNHHVIESGNKVTVAFTDGTVLETKIVGSDEYSDIAVLSLESSNELSVAEIGKSESSRVGDTVFAVGSPLGSKYAGSVTRGILSGKDRMMEVSLSSSSSSDYVMKVIQTDTAINPGNSGGPLCNSNGEVIGITSLKLTTTYVSQSSTASVEGMGFAIPIETAIEKANQILEGKETILPYIGIYMADAYTSYSSYYAIQNAGLTSGVLVLKTEKKSPASEAGLKENDIILAIDNTEVTNIAYFRYYLYQHQPGDTIKLTIQRDGKKQDINVKLGSNKQSM